MRRLTRPYNRRKVARFACHVLPVGAARRALGLLYPEHVASADAAEVVTRLITGSRFRARTRDHYGRHAAVAGFFAWKNVAVATAICSRGDTIIEVGANVGTETASFRDIVGATGQVFAIEPHAANQDALHDLIRLNRWTNVIVLPVALSNRTGEIPFAPPTSANSGTGHLDIFSDANSLVATTTLDAIGGQVGHATAIFSDTEGHEAYVLEGGLAYLAETKPVYTVEVVPGWLHRAGSSPDELFEKFVALGYVVYELTWHGLRKISAPGHGTADWVCIDKSRPELARRVSKTLLLYAMSPVALRAAHSRLRRIE